MTQRLSTALLTGALLLSCGGSGEDDRCARWFEPYPDLVSGTAPSDRNRELLDAMAHYARRDYAGAIPGLQQHVDRHPERADVGWFYLANCYLATGEPYKAELQLDFLEQWPGRTFRDELDWYNALCLLCSGQDDRALEAAKVIAGTASHTYKQQATDLVEALQ